MFLLHKALHKLCNQTYLKFHFLVFLILDQTIVSYRIHKIKKIFNYNFIH